MLPAASASGLACWAEVRAPALLLCSHPELADAEPGCDAHDTLPACLPAVCLPADVPAAPRIPLLKRPQGTPHAGLKRPPSLPQEAQVGFKFVPSSAALYCACLNCALLLLAAHAVPISAAWTSTC